MGVLAIAGGLLSTGALNEPMTDVVALVQKDKTQKDDAAKLNSGKVADWMYYEDVPEWSSVRGVPQVARPTQPEEPTRPAIAPPEHPHRVLFHGPPPVPRYTLEGPDDCMQPHNPVSYAHNYNVVATGSGSVTATWYDMGDPDTQKYELVAVPQYVNQFDYSRPAVDPKKIFTTIAAPKGCQAMKASVTGLVPGLRYTFSLMAQNKSAVNKNRIYSITRAQSEPITIK